MFEQKTSSSGPGRWGRRLFWGAILLLLAGMVGGYLYFSAFADRELRDAIALADRLDPGWRLDDVDAPTAAIPDEDNAAKVALLARSQMKTPWPSQTLVAPLQDHSPEVRLTDGQRNLLRGELAGAADALITARRLAGMPRGAFPPNLAADDAVFYSSQQAVRAIVSLLSYDVVLQVHEGDAAGATASCRAIFNASRTLGDRPVHLTYLVRVACRETGVKVIEETLAQTAPAEADLAQLQELLEVEEAVPLLLNALRAERAWFHRLFTGIESGEEPLSRHRTFRMDADGVEHPPVAAAFDTLGMPMVKYIHAWVLQYMTRLVESARLPLAQASGGPPPGILGLPPGILPQYHILAVVAGRLHSTAQRSQARMRSMIAALAAERYRQKHGKWPASLAEMAPGPLPESWTDPFDGQPLRYSLLPDGLVIYAIGPDGKDNGGTINRRNPYLFGSDIGVRLWNPDDRGQPPPERLGPPAAAPRK